MKNVIYHMRLMNFLPLTHGSWIRETVLRSLFHFAFATNDMLSLSLFLHQPASAIFTYLIRN